MTTYFVSRHPGARAWFMLQGVPVDHHVDHLCADDIQAGDTVIANLPVHVVADLCARGATYVHVAIDQPPSLRGRELNAQQLTACGARLEVFFVERTRTAIEHGRKLGDGTDPH